MLPPPVPMTVEFAPAEPDIVVVLEEGPDVVPPAPLVPVELAPPPVDVAPGPPLSEPELPQAATAKTPSIQAKRLWIMTSISLSCPPESPGGHQATRFAPSRTAATS